MNIITKDNLKEVNLPFPGFSPNTLIVSEQVNDNNDELQYRTNLLIRSYLKHIDEDIEVEALQHTLRDDFDAYVINNDNRVSNLEETVDNNDTTINNRVDDEVVQINTRISNEVAKINNDINNNIKTLENIIDEKSDTLELKNTLLYLKSGAKTLSVADLSGLGGNTVAKATYLSHGHPVNKTDWVYDDELGLYYIKVNHSLKTSLPIVTYYDGETNFNVFSIVKIVNANVVNVYTDEPVETYINVIDGTGNISTIQSILDDTQATDLRTWSSTKIQKEINNAINVLREELGLSIVAKREVL